MNTMATIPETLAIAVQHHQGGRLQAAEQIYRQILAVEPNHAVAIHFLGAIAYQAGKPDEAVACYRRALELWPEFAEAHGNLGMALKAQGELDEAIACYRRALEMKADFAEAQNNLGIALKEQGKLDEAIACYRRALELKPNYAEVHRNLGLALKEQGKIEEAVACCYRAVELKPDFAQAHSSLSDALRSCEGASKRELFFLSCTAESKQSTNLYRSLEKLQIGNFHFYEHNSRGLSECYNEYLDKLAGSDHILVLVHSDVTVADIFVQEKLSAAVATFNIVGLVGTSYFDLNTPTPHYAWPVWPQQHLSGSVEEVLNNGETTWLVYGPTPRRCVAMDGLFLAVDMRTIGSVRFDPRFTFHFYDLDFCLTALHAGLILGTTNVYVQHASLGDFASDAYRQAMQEFRAKWRD